MDWDMIIPGLFWYAEHETGFNDEIDEYRVVYRPDLNINRPWICFYNGQRSGAFDSADGAKAHCEATAH